MFELTAVLVAFLVPLAYSPDPGNMLCGACGARFGGRATPLPAPTGCHVATWPVTVVIGDAATLAPPVECRRDQPRLRHHSRRDGDLDGAAIGCKTSVPLAERRGFSSYAGAGRIGIFV